MRLDLGEFARTDPAQSLDAVGATSRLQLVQAWELGGVAGHDHLSAPLVGDAAPLAERVHAPHAVDTQLRLERSGLVVDTGVQNPGVVPGLVTPDLGLALEYGEPQPGASIEQLAGEGKSENSAAHHHEFALLPVTIGSHHVRPRA